MAANLICSLFPAHHEVNRHADQESPESPKNLSKATLVETGVYEEDDA
jgi:hypothetical protein